MSMNDSDLELLETYLDGQMPLADAEGLWRRLSVEKELAAALVDLRAQRELRLAVWQGMEPSESEAAALTRRVSRAMRGRTTWEYARRGLSYAVAAAACIIVGFQVGRTGGGGNSGPVLAQAASQSSQVHLASADDSSKLGAFQVAIRDQSGDVIATPRFATRQEAVDFVGDLNAMQSRSAAPTTVEMPERHDAGANVVPVSDEQF
jgi:hypothetical protein